MVVIEAGLGKSNKADLSLLQRRGRWTGRWTLKILSFYLFLFLNMRPFPQSFPPITLKLAELIDPLLRILDKNQCLAVRTENEGDFAILGIIL